MKNPVDEQYLRKEKVEWEFRENVSLDQIDTVESGANQARLGQALDPVLIDDYTRKAKGGEDFPAVVAYAKPTGKLVLIGGNNRVGAYIRAKRPGIDVYVVKTNDALVISRLTRSHNTLNGLPQDPQTNLEHAIFLVQNAGYSQKQAAKQMGVNCHVVQDEIRVRETRDRLRHATGIDTYKDLSRAACEQLGGITNIKHLTQLAYSLKATPLAKHQLTELLRELSDTVTESQGTNTIDAYFRRPDILAQAAKQGRVGAPKTKQSEAFRYATGLRNILQKYETFSRLGITAPEDQHRFNVLLSEIMQLSDTLWRSRAA